ncbi:MAG TPA: trypsin-like peptidase domain-containing protein [Iamia sp.]|nr:trypsin-like peptidase domain-containing protein [Iamia sp.]
MTDDDGAVPGPLPPEDRLWRHPSEVARAAAAAAAAASAEPDLAPGADSRRRRVLVTIGLLSGLAGAAATVVSLAALGAFTAPVVEREVAGPTAPPTTAVISATAIATGVAPAVVEVTATVGLQTRRGSGVVARSDGLILTSEQLVTGASTVIVTWPSGRQVEGVLEGVDDMTGLAAITVAGTGYPAATLDMTPPRPGDQAIAVSARPGGGAPTVVDATVNATSTHVTAGDGVLVGLIETDHAVPEDADGGALVDGDGNLRGICVALAHRTDAGWAVPAEVALRVADDLRRLGRVDRGWLGITGEPAATAGAVPAGFAVSGVMPGSPAELVGLTPGDIVLSVDDQRVRSLYDVKGALTLTRPGQPVVLEVNRGDETTLVQAVLTATPED